MLRELFIWLPFGAVPDISPAELGAALVGDRPPQLIDVRSAAEWDRGHIAGANNVPIHRLSGALAGLSYDTSRPVVAICLSGHRSIPAVRLLRRHGVSDVRQLKGGMMAWWRQGMPVVEPPRG